MAILDEFRFRAVGADIYLIRNVVILFKINNNEMTSSFKKKQLNKPIRAPDCGHLAGIPDRETEGSWWAPRWWWADKAAITTSCWAPWRSNGGGVTCLRTSRHNRPEIQEIRLTGETPAGRRAPVCATGRAGTNPDSPMMCWRTIGRTRWRHRSRQPSLAPSGSFATGNLGRKPFF